MEEKEQMGDKEGKQMTTILELPQS